MIFANDAFERLTGYSPEEAMGCNCRILQGPGTDPETVARMRAAIDAGQEGYFEVLNYRKDGSAFWNGLHISPVSLGRAPPPLYIGYQRDITAEVEVRNRQDLLARELHHRLGNLMAIVGMIVRTSRGGDGEESLRQVLEGRIRALAISNDLVFPHHRSGRESKDDGSRIGIPTRSVLQTVLDPVGHGDRISLAGPDLSLSDRAVTNVALAIHELSTNAVKYGALSAETGRIEIVWRQDDGSVLIDWIETGIRSAPLNEKPSREGMGSRLLRSIADASERKDAGFTWTGSQLLFRFDAALLQ